MNLGIVEVQMAKPPRMWVTIEDYLLIAERVLEIDARRLARMIPLGSVSAALAAPYAQVAGQCFYEDEVQRAGVLCARLIEAFLPDENRAVAFLCMLEHLERARLRFEHPPRGQAETAGLIKLLASGDISEADFVAWLRERVSPASWTGWCDPGQPAA
jgi:hypothetical protein